MPVDKLSGLMPLHIAPLPTDLAKAHKDHVLFPSEDPVFEPTAKGDVTRHIRAQFVDPDLHKHKHDHYSKPPLPTTFQDQFDYVQLAYAGYVPEECLDFSSYEYGLLRPFTPAERQLLNEGGAVPYSRLESLRLPSFVGRMLVDQQLVGENEQTDETVDRFLDTRGIGTRRKIGGELLRLAADKSVARVRDSYETARNKGLLEPSASANPSEVVLKQLDMASRELMQKLINVMHRDLKRQRIERTLQTGVDKVELEAA